MSDIDSKNLQGYLIYFVEREEMEATRVRGRMFKLKGVSLSDRAESVYSEHSISHLERDLYKGAYEHIKEDQKLSMVNQMMRAANKVDVSSQDCMLITRRLFDEMEDQIKKHQRTIHRLRSHRRRWKMAAKAFRGLLNQALYSGLSVTEQQKEKRTK